MKTFNEWLNLKENYISRAEVSSHPDADRIKKYFLDIENRIDQAEKSKNIQQLNFILKELESQMQENKAAQSKMNPQDRQKNVQLTMVSQNLQSKWEYLKNVISRVQGSMQN